ncbi:hypothetical protein BKA62DRAFT_3867 [Auriculariales sp. MPI-PUGE-AT-0066]|nr:hypothetical protein BKA62DRAFT_3867 [Auriculariales sp. MPI-PUGE-AT-0066]
MGRKHHSKANNEDAQLQAVQNRDIHQRLNFLYQASTYLAQCASNQLIARPSIAKSADAHMSEVEPPGNGKYGRRKGKNARNANRRHRKSLSLADLARSYIDSMHGVSTRTVTRIDPAVKRSLCKGCDAALIPGTLSCRTRILRTSKLSHIVLVNITCTQAACDLYPVWHLAHNTMPTSGSRHFRSGDHRDECGS